MKLRVLIVDDEAPARERLRSLLAELDAAPVADAGKQDRGSLTHRSPASRRAAVDSPGRGSILFRRAEIHDSATSQRRGPDRGLLARARGRVWVCVCAYPSQRTGQCALS